MLTKYTTKLLSILFRGIIIAFALLIIIIKDNILSYWVYLGAIIPYLFIYFKTLFKDGIYSKIRLINDFSLIILFSYGKEIDLEILIFTALPLINSPNHSGDRKSFLLYVFYIVALFIINDFTWSWHFLITAIPLYLINGISRLRNQYFKSISELNHKIELFLEKDLEVSKTYKIYDGLMDSINSLQIAVLLSKPEISQIICFRIVNGKVYLENSSNFIWSYSFRTNDINTYLEVETIDSYLASIPLTVNGKELNNNFFIHNNFKGQDYLFVFISKKHSFNKLVVLYLKRVLSATIIRVTRIIGIENEIKLQRKNMLRNFREKYFQIQNAEKAMHFIRNRFNTLDNFIEMSKDNLSGNMDSDDLKIYGIELERLERNYKILMERVKSILTKSDKPFSAANLESKSINFIFNLIREIWLDYFQDFPATININFELTEKESIKINFDGLYILISDWISNVNKYSTGKRNIIFNDDAEYFIITFENSFSTEFKGEIDSLKSDFNSTERDKILQRTSYGILIMKSILEEMGVKGIISVNEDILKLVLTLKKEGHENSDI